MPRGMPKDWPLSKRILVLVVALLLGGGLGVLLAYLNSQGPVRELTVANETETAITVKLKGRGNRPLRGVDGEVLVVPSHETRSGWVQRKRWVGESHEYRLAACDADGHVIFRSDIDEEGLPQRGWTVTIVRQDDLRPADWYGVYCEAIEPAAAGHDREQDGYDDGWSHRTDLNR